MTVNDPSFDRERPDVYGDAHPKALLRAIQEDGDFLLKLSNQHVVSSDQFCQDTMRQLFRLAAKYESNPLRFSTPLQGKILISAFYEPSTRTRLSFESAWHRLGGDIMSITDRSTTGIAKGECLEDVAEMFNNYGDCVVLRDNHADSIELMMDTLRIPIINAGNGTDEHPTQAMADMYAIFKWRPDLLEGPVKAKDKLKMGVIGHPRKMRTVRSLLKSLAVFSECFKEVVIITDCKDEKDLFSEEQREELEQQGLKLSISHDLNKVLPSLDITYINAIAWEGDGFETYGSKFALSAKSPLKENGIILHPLARGDELDKDLDNTPHNWYFSQARGAVFMRMALLTCMVQRAGRVIDVV
ncbi:MULTISPECIES: aspartate carbamoyltransferase [Gammaproteobacteria]|uniref:aspartate/ornithine carbamoyltransferase family protein n=1 Tax=Gammaproteobacteria TaxID=1236 RepID=UPI000DD0381E|nr:MULTISPECIES: aspartate carbamoyltransferase [Gammaproteobacteria]RTE86935.1 aspartate carbamoyltransferase [Aliidiomarina sp. B3213]TCZ93275.1 aspartate carbamoyltransferase [Lysobacter sp. N42]